MEDIGTIKPLSTIDKAKGLGSHVLDFDTAFARCVSKDGASTYSGILFGYIEQAIAKGQLEGLIADIDEGFKYFDLSTDRPFIRDVTVLRLEAISEQIYKKGVSAASRAVSYALQVDTQFYYTLGRVMRNAVANYFAVHENSDIKIGGKSISEMAEDEAMDVPQYVQDIILSDTVPITSEVLKEGTLQKFSLSPPTVDCIPENTLTFLIGGAEYYMIYDKSHPRYKDIEREYRHRIFGSESSLRFHPCRLCGKSEPQDMSTHVCADNRARLHKTCLKRYLADSTDEKVLQSKKASLCPFCETPIDLAEILGEAELRKYKREKAMQKVKSIRASSLSGYVAKLKKEPEKPRAAVSRESSRERLKRHEFVCDLCGKNCEIDYINNKVFIHSDKNCTGGCSHKECLISALSMYFWRRYEKYYGQRIILLTKSEAKALRHEWVCPQCGKPLKEAELRSLVTEREWNQQLEMRAKREKPKLVRSPLKKLLERVRGEISRYEQKKPMIKVKKALVPGEFVKEPRAGSSLKPWNWSQRTKDAVVSSWIAGQAAMAIYICWNYWSSMIKI